MIKMVGHSTTPQTRCRYGIAGTNDYHSAAQSHPTNSIDTSAASYLKIRIYEYHKNIGRGAIATQSQAKNHFTTNQGSLQTRFQTAGQLENIRKLPRVVPSEQ